jgi:hypothetical protein
MEGETGSSFRQTESLTYKCKTPVLMMECLWLVPIVMPSTYHEWLKGDA